MDQAITHQQILDNLMIHHCENRIELELSNLKQLEDVNTSFSYDYLKEAKTQLKNNIKLLWATYQELPGVDTKAKAIFLSSNSKLIDILDVKITSQ